MLSHGEQRDAAVNFNRYRYRILQRWFLCHSTAFLYRPTSATVQVLKSHTCWFSRPWRTRSSATAEKQRVSCACLPRLRLSNWSCSVQNTAESQRLYYCWHSNALIQELLAENGFCHEIATLGHSRSFILQSVTGRQGVAYRYVILLAVSLKFSYIDVAT